MNFSFSEEHNLIRETARGFLKESSPSTAVREWMETETGYCSDYYKSLAENMGWAALAIPEDYEGLGLGYVDLAIIMEEIGYCLTASPLFATACLAAQALIHGGTPQQKQSFLPQIAAGAKTGTLAYGANGSYDVSDLSLRWKEDEGEIILSGTASQVIDGATSDILVAAARKIDSNKTEDVRLFIIEKGTKGLTTQPLKTMDQTRRLSTVVLEKVSVSSAMQIDGGYDTLMTVLNIASIMQSAEQLGVARWCLDNSVSYALERVQFGRAIGSFQAIKHKCADMMVEVESGISAIYYAACICDSGNDELSEAAPLAKATVCETAMNCAAEAVQIHGGIGITWEADVHLYFKRARAGEQMFGSPSWHREKMAQAIGL